MAKIFAEVIYGIGVRKTREKYLKKMIKLRKKNQLLSLYARCLFDILIHRIERETDTCDRCVHAGICKHKDTVIPEECVYRMVARNACMDYLRSDKEVRKAFNRFIRLPNTDVIDIVGKESFKEFKEKEKEFNEFVNGSDFETRVQEER